MMPVAADWSFRPQLKSRYRGNDIEAGLTLQTQWLQGERIVEPADQAVGTPADAHDRTGRGADITAGQRGWPDTRGQREDRPTENGFIAKSGLSSEALHAGLIVLRRANRRREDAIECARRKDDETGVSRAMAAQLASLDIRVRGRGHRADSKAKKRRSDRRASNKFERHDIPFHRH